MPKTKSMCSGCRDDYYNRNRDGGCWSFAKAKIGASTKEPSHTIDMAGEESRSARNGTIVLLRSTTGQFLTGG